MSPKSGNLFHDMKQYHPLEHAETKHILTQHNIFILLRKV